MEQQLLYNRVRKAAGPVDWVMPTAEDEVKALLLELQREFMGHTLEIVSIERIEKEAWKNNFEAKKIALQKRSESDDGLYFEGKYKELGPEKQEMRDILLGKDRVLDLRVYAGVDSNQALEGIAETGFDSTRCGNGWFARGNYVTQHAWYAARYGMGGCYGGNNGILDPRSEVAIEKGGRLLVCRAVVSNVYPILRSCDEDHEYKDFDEAARKEIPWSKWYSESKAISIKRGYDAHFVRVKKIDPSDDYSNFQACGDDEKFSPVGIADELVIMEEEQLLPQYFVKYEVAKADLRSVAVGAIFKSVYPFAPIVSCQGESSCESLHSSLKVSSDSPGKVAMLFTGPADFDHLMKKRERLKSKGFSVVPLVNIRNFHELRQAIEAIDPSLIYVEGVFPNWHRMQPQIHFIEELALHLGDPRPDQPWSQWRGCILNFCDAPKTVVKKLCGKHQGKLHMLTWASLPSKEDRENLCELLFTALNFSAYVENKQHAFEEACAKIMSWFSPDKLVLAPVFSIFPAHENRRTKFELAIQGTRTGLLNARRVLTRSGNSKKVCMESRLIVDPKVPKSVLQDSNDQVISELEVNLRDLLPKEVCEEDPGFLRIGSLCFRISLDAFQWLFDRLHMSDTPLYLKLPMALGGGETRVQKVLPGNSFWFEVVMPAIDVHGFCARLRAELASSNMPQEQPLNIPIMSLTGEQVTIKGFPLGASIGDLKSRLMVDRPLRGWGEYYQLIYDDRSLRDEDAVAVEMADGLQVVRMKNIEEMHRVAASVIQRHWLLYRGRQVM